MDDKIRRELKEQDDRLAEHISGKPSANEGVLMLIVALLRHSWPLLSSYIEDTCEFDAQLAHSVQ